MNNLVLINEGKVVVSSRMVAEKFGKELSKVHRSIEGIKATIDVATFGEMFTMTFYEDSYERTQVEYTMNRDGWSLLTMGFTGAEAMQWKLKYISAFNEMEEQLRKPVGLPQTYRDALVALLEGCSIAIQLDFCDVLWIVHEFL